MDITPWSTTCTMALTLSNVNDKSTLWGDMLLEAEKAPAAAGASTPVKEEKERPFEPVKASRHKKTKSRTTAATAEVAVKLDFGSTAPPKYSDKNNKFAALAETSEDDE